MKRVRTSLLTLILLVCPMILWAQEGTIQVHVKGLSCPFCVYGVEKKLSKLSFLDTSQFNRGVFTDIETHRVTLALLPGESLDLPGVSRAIIDAGFEPITVHLRLLGPVVQQGEQYVLTHASTGERFLLTGEHLESLSGEDPVDTQVHLDADSIALLVKDQPVPVIIDTLGVVHESM